MQAGQLKPIGAGLVGLYLDAVWPVNAEKTGLGKAVEEMHEVTATAWWSNALGTKLEIALQPLLGYMPVG